METDIINIFYMGIAYGVWEKEPRRLKKEGLTIQKAGRELPYLWGGGRGKKGKVQIYYALLPEYQGKGRFSGALKRWKPEKVKAMLEQTAEKAAVGFTCRELLCAFELNQDPEQVPQELLAVCLYRQRPFDRICISLPRDGGEYQMQYALELIFPYLTRIRQVILKGSDSEASKLLEEYLYEEFGIIMVRSDAVQSGVPWLDLRDKEEKIRQRRENPGSQGYISRDEALKFLDTAVKNGYNTDVN